MKLRMIGLVLGAAVAAGSLTAADADLPSGEKVFERYVEVTGGEAAYAARKTEYAKGTVSMPAANIAGTFEMWSEAPDRAVQILQMPGIGKMEIGANGTDAWELSAVMGPRLKDGDEKNDALREALFNLPTQWRKLYKKVETVGVEKVEGVDCFKVMATTHSDRSETWYFNKETGLTAASKRTAITSMGEMTAESLAKEYKKFGGVLVPTLIILKTAGQEMHLKFESVESNVAIPAGKFDPPAEIKQLMKPKAPAKKAA